MKSLLFNYSFNFQENVNIIVIDWKEGALMPNYLAAAANTKIVGVKIANFILKNRLDPKKIHCIG